MVLRIGHRGASGHEPENTLKSFKKAIDLNADMVELDVHLCKSGEVVVIHDDTVNRTTESTGSVHKLTLDELKTLDAGKGERIPTLEEVFNLIDGRIGVNIELKAEGTAMRVYETMMNVIEKSNWSHDHFLVSSFNLRELTEIRRLSEDVRIGVLTAGNPFDVLGFADQIGAYSINLYYQRVTREFISRANDLGLKVFVWTVNKRKDIEWMKAMRVDGIISDYPDRV